MSLDLILVIVAVILSFFFSGSETAYTAAGRLAMEVYHRHGRRGSRHARRFHDHPNLLFSTTLVGNNLAGVLYSTMAALVLRRAGVPLEGIVVISPLLILFFGEIMPKTIAREHPERWALTVSFPLWLSFVILYPMILAARIASDLLLSLLGLPRGRADPGRITLAEIRSIWVDLRETGTIDHFGAELLDKAISLRQLKLREVMTPRTDIAGLLRNASVQEAEALVQTRGYSRLPVFENDLDHIVGLVLAKDLLRHPESIEEIMRPVRFLPEQSPADSLLEILNRSRSGMVVVIDEHGGTAGIATLEDILEEIVGAIEDEHDSREPRGRRIAQNAILISGRMSLEALVRFWKVQLPEGEYDTVGGLFLAHFGRIPGIGERIELPKWRLTVASADERRVKRVLIRRIGAKS